MGTWVQVPCRGRAGGYERVLGELGRRDVLRRVWQRDHTLWGDGPDGIANRLGWLDAPSRAAKHLPEWGSLARAIPGEGLRDVVLLGMGGSSLAAEVLAAAQGRLGRYPFEPRADGPTLRIGDSTEPAAVHDLEQGLRLDRTLFVSASKSGTTLETSALTGHFLERCRAALGQVEAGRRFVAITDEGSALERDARELGFRAIVHGEADIGGRFSALSAFGLLPPWLVGVDPEPIVAAGARAAEACAPHVAVVDNPAARLAALLAAAVGQGRDKLAVLVSEPFAALGDWVEQLVAESTGKDGRGVLPVVGHPLERQLWSGPDRVLVVLGESGDAALAEATEWALATGAPVARMEVARPSDLGAAFFVWELATAVLGHLLGVQPFDQPDVEAAKVRARRGLQAYRVAGRLELPQPSVVEGPVALTAAGSHASVADALGWLCDAMEPGPGRYIAVQAFLPPRPEVLRALERLRLALAVRTGGAVTVGIGPRYLHSTGQLHKGDAGAGVFLQIVAGSPTPVPDRSLEAAAEGGPFGTGVAGDPRVPFEVLCAAQAVGDFQALAEAGRRIVRVDVGADAAEGVDRLVAALCAA